jgi:hypothetical protein
MRCLCVVVVTILLGACTGRAGTDPEGNDSDGGGSDSGSGTGFDLPDAPEPDGSIGGLVWQVSFNETPLGEYTADAIRSDWGGNVRIENGVGTGRGQIVEGENAFEGRSLRAKYPEGTHSSENNAIQFRVKLPQSYDELFLSYRLRFEAGFDFVKGGKIPGLTGGKGNTGGDVPDGRDGWSARMMWRSGGAAVQYVYYPDQPGGYGEDFEWSENGNKRFPPGTWVQVEHRIVINTPGKRDGLIQAWWNGELALDIHELRFRDVDTFSIDSFYFSTFFGGSGSEWNAHKDEYVTFDDFIIATAPITHRPSARNQAR